MVDYYGIEVAPEKWEKLPKIPTRERLESILKEKGLTFASLKTYRNVMITKKERVENGEFTGLSIDEAQQVLDTFDGVVVETNGFLKITTNEKAMKLIEDAKKKLSRGQ